MFLPKNDALPIATTHILWTHWRRLFRNDQKLFYIPGRSEASASAAWTECSPVRECIDESGGAGIQKSVMIGQRQSQANGRLAGNFKAPHEQIDAGIDEDRDVDLPSCSEHQ